MKKHIIIIMICFLCFGIHDNAMATNVKDHAKKRAVFLFPGFATSEFCPKNFSQQKTIDGLVKLFQASGWILNKDLFVFFYNSQANIELGANNIQETVALQVEEALKVLPFDTKIDLIGHSLGHFVALHTALTYPGLYERVGVLVGLGGTANGIKSQFVPELPGLLPIGKCINSVTALWRQDSHAVQTYLNRESDYMSEFKAQWAESIRRLQKCSIYTSENHVLPKSGNFYDDNSKNIKLEEIKREGLCKALKPRGCHLDCDCIEHLISPHLELTKHHEAQRALMKTCLMY